jgi:hypothetical protein
MSEGGSHKRCILMTGHVDPTEGLQELDRAGVKMLYKPFSLSDLHREVVLAKQSLCVEGEGQT